MKLVGWLTADQAREYLGLSTLAAFYVWKCRAKPRTYRLRGRLRFRQVDLDACVTNEQVTPKLRMVGGRG
jgi:hypothetical protein